MTGRFIVFEGGDGSGKSTQAKLLATRLGATLTHQPGGTAIGQMVRSVVLDPDTAGLDPRAEALLMAADKAQHVAQLIEPALRTGDVVCDRYVASSVVYQGFGRGLDRAQLSTLLDFATRGLRSDLTVLLDVPIEVVERRLGANRDRFEREPRAFHERIRSGYQHLAAEDPARWVVVDGSGNVDDVAAEVARRVLEKLDAP